MEQSKIIDTLETYQGFGRGHGRRRQAALPLVAGSSGKIPKVSAGRQKTVIKPTGVDRTVPK